VSPTRTFVTLVRRELWEHRALVYAPLAVAVLFVVILASLTYGMVEGPGAVRIDGKEIDFVAAMTGENQRKFFSIVISSMILPQLLVALVVVFFYLLDSLYSERKDRSILFWKSLPVSDAMTVASKAFVALIVVPMVVYVAALLSGLIALVITRFKVAGTPFEPMFTWHTADWFVVQGALLLNLVIAALWYLPIAAALLLISVAARRAATLWAILPPLILTIVERSTLGTQRVFAFLVYRFTGYFDAMGADFERAPAPTSSARVERVSELYDQIIALPLFANIDLWLGVAAGLAMLALAARLRRWRDDA
jgi:ABC-2 type transport system permease protein